MTQKDEEIRNLDDWFNKPVDDDPFGLKSVKVVAKNDDDPFGLKDVASDKDMIPAFLQEADTVLEDDFFGPQKAPSSQGYSNPFLEPYEGEEITVYTKTTKKYKIRKDILDDPEYISIDKEVVKVHFNGESPVLVHYVPDRELDKTIRWEEPLVGHRLNHEVTPYNTEEITDVYDVYEYGKITVARTYDLKGNGTTRENGKANVYWVPESDRFENSYRNDLVLEEIGDNFLLQEAPTATKEIVRPEGYFEKEYLVDPKGMRISKTAPNPTSVAGQPDKKGFFRRLLKNL